MNISRNLIIADLYRGSSKRWDSSVTIIGNGVVGKINEGYWSISQKTDATEIIINNLIAMDSDVFYSNTASIIVDGIILNNGWGKLSRG